MARLARHRHRHPHHHSGALAGSPKSPWRSREQLTDPVELLRLDLKQPSPLDDLGLRHIYELYTVLAPLMTPLEADECELWQLAAVLGADPSGVSEGGLDERLQREASPEVLAERVARSHVKPRRHGQIIEEAEPPPANPPPPDADLTLQVMRQMGIRTLG